LAGAPGSVGIVRQPKGVATVGVYAPGQREAAADAFAAAHKQRLKAKRAQMNAEAAKRARETADFHENLGTAGARGVLASNKSARSAARRERMAQLNPRTRAAQRREASNKAQARNAWKEESAAQRSANANLAARREAAAASRRSADEFHESLGDAGARSAIGRKAAIGGGLTAGGLGVGAAGYNSEFLARHRAAVHSDRDRFQKSGFVSGLRAAKGKLMATKPAKSFLGTRTGQAARTTYQAGRSGFQNAPAGFGQQMKAGARNAWGASTTNQKYVGAAVTGTGLLGTGYGMGTMLHKADDENTRRVKTAVGGVGLAAGGASAVRGVKELKTVPRKMVGSRIASEHAAATRVVRDSTRRHRFLTRRALKRGGLKLTQISQDMGRDALRSGRKGAFATLGGAAVAYGGTKMVLDANRKKKEELRALARDKFKR
jgi:hypothetical protein